jgi:hypothetical protein
VEHDDAERVARRNRSPEAEFLELETVEQFEISEPPPHPDALFAELVTHDPAEAAEPLLHFLLPPDGFAAQSEEGMPGGVRWFLLEPSLFNDEEDLQRILDSGGEEL